MPRYLETYLQDRFSVERASVVEDNWDIACADRVGFQSAVPVTSLGRLLPSSRRAVGAKPKRVAVVPRGHTLRTRIEEPQFPIIFSSARCVPQLADE